MQGRGPVRASCLLPPLVGLLATDAVGGLDRARAALWFVSIADVLAPPPAPASADRHTPPPPPTRPEWAVDLAVDLGSLAGCSLVSPLGHDGTNAAANAAAANADARADARAAAPPLAGVAGGGAVEHLAVAHAAATTLRELPAALLRRFARRLAPYAGAADAARAGLLAALAMPDLAAAGGAGANGEDDAEPPPPAGAAIWAELALGLRGLRAAALLVFVLNLKSQILPANSELLAFWAKMVGKQHTQNGRMRRTSAGASQTQKTDYDQRGGASKVSSGVRRLSGRRKPGSAGSRGRVWQRRQQRRAMKSKLFCPYLRRF